MQLSTLQYKEYTGRVTNLSQKKDITKYVEECNIALPHTTYISSMEAKFTLDEKLVEVGNEVKIEVLDEVGNILYTLQGKATIPRRIKQHTGTELFEYSIKDSYDKLFEKVVAKDMTFYDLYFCNIGDKNNSLLHKIAEALGFREEQCNFQNAIFPNGQYMRVPFIYFEENTRWVDKLQAFLEATNGVLYVQNGVLHFRLRDSSVDTSFQLDRSNLLNHIEESQKEILQNGVKVVYDRFEKLENQVVFNLQSKVIVEPNTSTNSNVPTMRLSYITSSVSNPTLTKATGYYFTSENPNSKGDITLQENVHYKIETWSATGAEVKFLNPLRYKLYIDSFEIKGVPLAMYENNEVNVMFPSITEKTQENFMTLPKSLMVQTQEQASYLAKQAMQKLIVNGKEYSFTTEFLHQIQVGKRYHLELEDIQADIEVRSIQISLKPNQFRMDIVADSLTEPLGEVKTSNKYSANPKGQYIDLKPIEEKVNQTKEEVKLLERDVRSKLYRMNTVPTEDVKEKDVWLNPQTNEWKKFYNGVWNPISEKEILPSMKMYNSLDGNVIKLQGTADKVGAYLLNDGEKFGGLNGELAHVTFDKLGQFEAENPNNRVALNIKDPANPSRVTSQILLGVTDITDEKWKDTIFAIGDEASPSRIEFKNGQVKQIVNGKEIAETLSGLGREVTFEVAGNANTYYPVFFTSDIKRICRFVVYRNLYEKAPGNIWNPSQPTHPGALQLEMTTTFGSNWDGNNNEIIVHKFNETYTTIASKIYIPHLAGILIWLRGGGAIYHAYVDDIEINRVLKATVLLQGYDNPPYNPKYAETEIGKAGTYEETGAASTLKNLFTKEKINTVYNYANTVQGALDTGDFTITGKTNFDGSARFLSRGTNEVITIANGAIDFHRDGKRLTRIKNIRHGTIATDSQGKAVINFDGFKQPMIVHTSIKSAHFGKNMASVFCYAEHISGTRYRFFVGGTNEYWVEATPVKTIGIEWKADNAMNSTLSEIGGRLQGFTEKEYAYSQTTSSKYSAEKIKEHIKNKGITTLPRFNLKVIREDGGAQTILLNRDYTVKARFRHDMPINGTFYRWYLTMDTVDFSSLFNILKKYSSRTNVKFKIVITILEKNLNLEIWNEESGKYNSNSGTRKYKFGAYKGIAYTLKMADFVGMFITASASTSTLGGVTGTGEVSYIAMEID